MQSHWPHCVRRTGLEPHKFCRFASSKAIKLPRDTIRGWGRELSLKKELVCGMIDNEGFWLSVTDFPTLVVKLAKGSDIAL